jgi:hypothetical protein
MRIIPKSIIVIPIIENKGSKKVMIHHSHKENQDPKKKED